MDAREALYCWVVRVGVPYMPAAERQRVLDRVGPVPEHVRRGTGPCQAEWLLRRARTSPRVRQVLTESLLAGTAPAWSAAQNGPEALAEVWVAWSDYGPVPVLEARWALAEQDQADVYDAAVALLPEESQAAVAEALEEVQEEAAARDAASRTRAAEGARIQAEAEAGVHHARRQQRAAVVEAGRQAARADRAATEAARRVAAAERARRALEAEVADLRRQIAERDDLLTVIAREYEDRLAAGARNIGAAESGGAALAGRAVLVVGDPGRAAAYSAYVRALGARSVEFLDGTASPGARLAAAASAANVVVLVITYAKHRAEEAVRAHLRSDARVVAVRRAGMRAFRDALRAACGSPATAARQ